MKRLPTLVGLVLLTISASSPAQEKPWSERFPVIAKRIPHLDKRLNAKDEAIRLRVLTLLTTVRPRDSKNHPPFLKAVLKDPSPKIRGQALRTLWDHDVTLAPKELPKSFDVPLVGDFHWQDPKWVARMRVLAKGPGPQGGWALYALALIGDKQSVATAKRQLKSDNVFVRFTAAIALIRLGEKKEGIDALHRITDARDDESGFYRYRAAETLFRAGDREAIQILFQMMERGVRSGYVDGPRDILEDLTGQYFLTAAEGRKWWSEQHRKK